MTTNPETLAMLGSFGRRYDPKIELSLDEMSVDDVVEWATRSDDKEMCYGSSNQEPENVREWKKAVYFEHLVTNHLDYCLLDDSSGVAEAARHFLMDNVTLSTRDTVLRFHNASKVNGKATTLFLAGLEATSDLPLAKTLLGEREEGSTGSARPSYDDDLRKFVNKLKAEETGGEVFSACVLALQDPGKTTSYLVNEAVRDKSKLPVLARLLASLQVSHFTSIYLNTQWRQHQIRMRSWITVTGSPSCSFARQVALAISLSFFNRNC